MHLPKEDDDHRDPDPASRGGACGRQLGHRPGLLHRAVRRPARVHQAARAAGDIWGVLSIADPPERSTGHVEIAAGSIDTGEERRDARVGSEGFLEAGRFPSPVFRRSDGDRTEPHLRGAAHPPRSHRPGVELGRDLARLVLSNDLQAR